MSDGRPSRWPALLGFALTALMVAGLVRALAGDGLAGLTRAVPTGPLYYLMFAGLYFALPLGDWLIFRRLWGLPLSALAATIKKRVANEVLFGYSGEAYFYAWARTRARVDAPFGAVKDVSILSALAGNGLTLALMGAALLFARPLLPGELLAGMGASAAYLVVTSVPFLIFSRRVFSLSKPERWWVFRVHLGRNLATVAFLALAWAAALPAVPAAMWLLLAGGRMLVSRLPLVPNKDLLFANFALLLLGGSGALSGLVAFTAALTLVTHLALMGLFGLLHVAQPRAAATK